MTRRYTGGFLSAKEQATDANTANGIFSVQDAAALTAAGSFPTGNWSPQRSLRFRRAASAYLTRTPSVASGQNKWTLSTWVKRGSLGDSSSQIIGGNTTTSGGVRNVLQVEFGSDNALWVYAFNNGSGYYFQRTSSAVFRDPSAWYHLVVQFDPDNSNSSNKVIAYINGQQLSWGTSSDSGAAGNIGSSSYRSINNTFRNDINGGYQGGGVPIYFGDQHLSEMYMVSGSIVPPSFFATTHPETGTWVPKRYTGTYGTNGFYLDFSDNTGATASTLGADRSGNSNNWTPNNITVSGVTSTTLSYTSVGTTTWTAPANVSSVNYLVVGGGGAGGSAGPTMYDGGAAGGGAGGMLTGTLAVNPGTVYSIYIGAGGTGAANRTRGASGDNSVFSSSSTSIIAYGGGGGGGGANTTSGANGGSGGGGANGGAAGTGIAGQGNDGGFYVGSPGNGGGGRGSVGGSATNNNGANGGTGATSDISGSTVTYAGGGGGGGYQLGGGSGGSSVGGNGGSNNNNGANATGTGSGGGGSGGTYNTTGTLTGGSGANGTIILSYSVPDFTYDSSVDVPGIPSASSPTDFGGVVRGNYCTLNPQSFFATGASSANSNLTLNVTTAGGNLKPTIGVSSGKYYSEFTIGSIGGNSSTNFAINVSSCDTSSAIGIVNAVYYVNGQTYNYATDSFVSYGDSYTTNDIIGVAIDCDNFEVTFYKNGVSQGVLRSGIRATPNGAPVGIIATTSGGSSTTTVHCNFGQRPFRYAPPNGFKSICTTNLPNPVIKRATDHFDVKTWTGNGTTQIIGATQKQTSAYAVNKSLRFRKANSAYLGRTPTATGNQKTWTWSGWVKQTLFASNGTQWLITSGNSGSIATNYTALSFSANGFLGNANQLQFFSTLSNSTVCAFESSQRFGDCTEWSHVVLAVDTTQVNSVNRVKLYVDGREITSFATATYPSLNTDIPFINSSSFESRIGSIVSYGSFDGYMAEVNFIDGQALTPSSFGAFDANNNWVPQRYAGTFGTQGYYLPFNDPTSTTTIGYDRQLGLTDSSKNNWTANNISVTAGATYDSMFDSPTDTVDSSGNIVGDYTTLDPAYNGTSVTTSNGSLDVAFAATGGWTSSVATGFLPTTGKWYWEGRLNSSPGGSDRAGIGFVNKLSNAVPTSGYGSGGNSNNWLTFYMHTSGFYYNSEAYSYGTTYTSGDTIGMAYDADNNIVYVRKNGTWMNSADPAAGTGGFLPPVDLRNGWAIVIEGWSGATWTVNFGQRAFANSAPTGFRSLNTKNLKDVGSFNLPDTFGNYVNTPDLIWIKSRSTANNHILQDTVRGTSSYLDLTNDANQTPLTSGVQAFLPNGFQIGSISGGNGSGNSIVGWTWNRGKTPGFDIVTYAGNGTNGRMIPHNLGQVPAMYFTKCLTSYNDSNGFLDWNVWHKSVDVSSYGGNKTLYLTSDIGTNAGAGGYFANPTSSEFSPNQTAYDNVSGHSYLAYLWAEVPGFSNFGFYTGNGSDNGPFIYTGFRPKWLMVKRRDNTSNWEINDTVRQTTNPVFLDLSANSSQVENYTDGTTYIFTANGFKITDGSSTGTKNVSSATYIYAAFAEAPFKYANAR